VKLARRAGNSKPLDGLIDQGAYLILVTHVGADELGVHAERAQLSRQRLTGFVAATGDDERAPS
jgi:predicted aspartyl protease